MLKLQHSSEKSARTKGDISELLFGRHWKVIASKRPLRRREVATMMLSGLSTLLRTVRHVTKSISWKDLSRSMAQKMIDTLVDAGPLIALFNHRDEAHSRCAELLRSLNCAFYTTLPVLTEAMYFLGRFGGHQAQKMLWVLVHRGDLLLEHHSPQELLRMTELMEKYRDHPMDFADASLVALAERLSLRRIFTLDYNDFSKYRLQNNRAFTLLGSLPKE